jgi:hypothetical protein
MTALDFRHARPDVEPWQTVLWGNSAGATTALYVGCPVCQGEVRHLRCSII